MSIFDLYDALADHLGYVLPRVNAPTPEGARRPQVLTDSRVSPFLARVISGEQLARANDKAAPAGLKGWWGSQSLPETKDPKIRQEWGELLAAGRLADLAFWHEAWCQEALPAQLTARLIAFQTRHTVLQDGDACPAPWGAVGAQAAVALYNLYHLIEARAAGVADGGLQEVAGQLTEWLTKVPTFSTPVSGDLILLDLFSQDLERKSFEYDQQLERLGLELRQAREARSQALAAHARLRWWPGAAASRRKRREAWRVVATQCRELEAREAWQKIAVKHLTDLRIAWQRLSPLTGLRLRANAAPTAATPSPPPEVADPSSSDPARFTLLPIAVDPAAEGLQHWVAIRMAERCALSRLANPLPSPVAALFRTASVQVNSDDEEAWRLRRFLLLFYFH
ncbi:MAG: hypothetical protein K0Q72_603 [Armatimonadetes bacterium]|jgi:hypothetical protein|nr:hypothetical protein [Armatimonadota bacterium]